MPWLEEHKENARNLMRENAPKIFIISIIFIVIVTLMSELQFGLLGTGNVFDQYIQHLAAGELPNLGTLYSYLRPNGMPPAFVLWLLSPVIYTGYKSYCLIITRGQPGEHKNIFDGFLVPGKIMLIQIITSIFVMLWSLLFFFPGLVAYYRYRQAYYILLDDPTKGALQCIRESKHMMRRNKLDLFLLDLSFVGWSLLNIFLIGLMPLPFALPIVSILLTPYHGLTCAAFYNRLISSFTV